MHSPCARRHPPLSPPAGRYGPGNVLGRFAPERRMGRPRGRPMLYGRRALEEQMNALTQYRAAAPNMLPGDVIAFAGRAPLSFIIDGYTGSKLSHVAMVRRTPTVDVPGVYVTESTIFTDPVTKKKISGPQTHPLEQVLTVDYAAAGSCAWHLALADEVRAQIDWTKFYAFIAKCEDGSVTYDIPGYFAYLWRSIPFIGAHVCQSETYRDRKSTRL